MSEDQTNLGIKLKRYAQVSTTLGGLAARLAGQHYLGVGVNPEHATSLKQALGGLKGPLMKVAQFLATIPGTLPPEYAEELSELQSNAPPMGWNFVRRRMTNELGPDWRQCFNRFDQEATAAASLGQVHQAEDLLGNSLACKLQYPDMNSVIEADLEQLKIVLGLYHLWSKSLDTKEVQSEIVERLHEELDYHNEAQNITIYQRIFANNSAIKIPLYYPDLSTKRLLTMSWMPGQSLLSFADAPEDFRNTLADTLFKAWYKPFYHYGIIHGDPHPGNYKVEESGTLNLLDFGCVRIFPSSFIQGVIDLYNALLHDNPEQAVHAYETWGFKNLNKELIAIMNQWARLLYDPLLDDRVRPIQESNSGAVGWEVASKVHSELHQLGGLRPPREFVFMDRAAVGIGSVFMRLNVKRNWHQLFNQLIEDFSVDKVQKAQDEMTAIK